MAQLFLPIAPIVILAFFRAFSPGDRDWLEVFWGNELPLLVLTLSFTTALRLEPLLRLAPDQSSYERLIAIRYGMRFISGYALLLLFLYYAEREHSFAHAATAGIQTTTPQRLGFIVGELLSTAFVLYQAAKVESFYRQNT